MKNGIGLELSFCIITDPSRRKKIKKLCRLLAGHIQVPGTFGDISHVIYGSA
jgi:hypothetical protein